MNRISDAPSISRGRRVVNTKHWMVTGDKRMEQNPFTIHRSHFTHPEALAAHSSAKNWPGEDADVVASGRTRLETPMFSTKTI
ncbi:MAG: hypothetical protein H0X34_19400 [Chthoniobacterales bacterium]|nr:hypothetical protein [Chthoniobacterales bacterium]